MHPCLQRFPDLPPTEDTLHSLLRLSGLNGDGERSYINALDPRCDPIVVVGSRYG